MFFYKSWLFNSASKAFCLQNWSIIFCSDYFWVNIFSIFSTLYPGNLYLTFITLISKAMNYFLLLCFRLENLDLSDRQTNKAVRFFSEHFVCRFHFLWPKIMCKVFAPKTIRCSRYFSNFYRFYFWLRVYHFL